MKPAARDIALLILDVDGVLTDGRLWFGDQGEVMKVFHVRDGYGIKQLQKAGIRVAIISGRTSAALRARMAELGVSEVAEGVADKAAALADLLSRLKIAPAQVACLCDDTPDLPLMLGVGLPAAVADAQGEVIAAASFVTRAKGGRGAVRELCDWLLQARVGTP